MQQGIVTIGMLAGGLGLFLLAVGMITDGLKDANPAGGNTNGSSSGGGGGGCAVNPNAELDPTLPMLILLSLFYLLRSRWNHRVRC